MHMREDKEKHHLVERQKEDLMEAAQRGRQVQVNQPEVAEVQVISELIVIHYMLV